MSDLDAYRLKCRAWLESVVPTFGKRALAGLSEQDHLAMGRRYQRAKFDAGFAGINWDPEFGGQGLSPLHKVVFEQEEMTFGMPMGYFGVSLGISVPVVMRFPAGSGTGAAAQHSQSLEAWLGHVPGLKVIQPATPHDVKGMLLAAVADPDPVMIFEHKLLYKMKGPVPEGHYTVPIGKAEVRREGRDLTIVATSIMVHKALEAAEALSAEGLDIEVVDLRTIRPMDKATIIESVKKTSRLLCVYEAVKTLGIGAEVSATIAESEAFDYLDAPIVRLGGAETPIPYNPELEKATVPQVPDIVAAARDLIRGKR